MLVFLWAEILTFIFLHCISLQGSPAPSVECHNPAGQVLGDGDFLQLLGFYV